MLFASSREVYGQQIRFPVRENHCELMPINIYAKSKLAAENLFLDARESGLVTGVVRLSSVYGDLLDHKTRVVPAYVRAAAHGSPLIIEGREEHYCDLTHVSDLADALYRFIKKLDAGEALPPIHLTSGIATSLVKLANMAIDFCQDSSTAIQYKAPRSYDVSKFVGCPDFAKSILNWKTKISIEQGLEEMINNYLNLNT